MLLSCHRRPAALQKQACSTVWHGSLPCGSVRHVTQNLRGLRLSKELSQRKPQCIAFINIYLHTCMYIYISVCVYIYIYIYIYIAYHAATEHARLMMTSINTSAFVEVFVLIESVKNPQVWRQHLV